MMDWGVEFPLVHKTLAIKKTLGTHLEGKNVEDSYRYWTVGT